MANKVQKQLVQGIDGKHTDDPLMNPSAVADALGCTHTTVNRWINKGKIPFVLMPSGLRKIRKSELMKILEGAK